MWWAESGCLIVMGVKWVSGFYFGEFANPVGWLNACQKYKL
jgi:hypothetical protein